MGPIDPPSRGYHYILVCTDYVKKWAEVKALRVAREEKVVDSYTSKFFKGLVLREK